MEEAKERQKKGKRWKRRGERRTKERESHEWGGK
jgi:hypothetical protein